MSELFALILLIRRLMKAKDPVKTLLSLNHLELLGLATLVASLGIPVLHGLMIFANWLFG